MTSHLANLVARARGEGPVVRPVADSLYGRRREPIEPPVDAPGAPPPTSPTERSEPHAQPAGTGRARTAAERAIPPPTRQPSRARPPADGRADATEPLLPSRPAEVPSPTRPVAPRAGRPAARGRPPSTQPARAVAAEPRRSGAAEQHPAPAPSRPARHLATDPWPPPQDATGEAASPSPATPSARSTEGPARERVPASAPTPSARVAPAAAMAARSHSPVGRRAAVPREPDVVRVSIGRVEVRTVQPPAPQPARPSQSLDDYLRERDRSLGA